MSGVNGLMNARSHQSVVLSFKLKGSAPNALEAQIHPPTQTAQNALTAIATGLSGLVVALMVATHVHIYGAVSVRAHRAGA